MRILVTDDNATTRLLVAALLRQWGFDVTTAVDGEEAWEVLHRSDARLVITDWQMPRLNGTGLCKRIRSRSAVPYVYVLMLTNYSDSAHVVSGLSAGADDLITKPFNPAELRARVEVGRRILALQDELSAKNTELRRLNSQLHQMASTDGLTQLGNRRSFDEAIARVHSVARRYRRRYGVLLADVDHFKSINDRFGHPFGDRVLVEIGKRLREVTRQGDEVFRYGGEEVVVLTPEQDEEGLVALAERLRKAVAANQLDLDAGGTLTVTASIGGVIYDGVEDVDWARVVERADRALYASKRDGRDRTTLWTSPAA